MTQKSEGERGMETRPAGQRPAFHNVDTEQQAQRAERAEARVRELGAELNETTEALQGESDDNFARAERYREALERLKGLFVYDAVGRGAIVEHGTAARIIDTALSPDTDTAAELAEAEHPEFMDPDTAGKGNDG